MDDRLSEAARTASLTVILRISDRDAVSSPDMLDYPSLRPAPATSHALGANTENLHVPAE